MKFAREFITSAVIGGLFIVTPVYLTVLLLLKGMETVSTLVHPLAALLPDWVPATHILSLLLVVVCCGLVGIAARTRAGARIRQRMEVAFFERIPGYSLFRSLTQRLAGESEGAAWRPALAEDDSGALMPAFVIEELDDGRFTVFVPSIPTPLAGAVFILGPERVHLLDVPFTKAIKTISQWGSGSKDLVAAMRSMPRSQGSAWSARGASR